MNNVGDDITYSTRLAGEVLRYHAWPTLRPQTIGSHTWQLMRIYSEIFAPKWPASNALWTYMLQHDQTEIATGDNPYHVKKAHPELKVILDAMEAEAAIRMRIVQPDITPLERERFKFCDVMDMFEFGLVEISMGNTLAIPIVIRTARDLGGRLVKFKDPIATDLVDEYCLRHDYLLFDEYDLEHFR